MYILIKYLDNGHPINHSYSGLDTSDFEDAKNMVKKAIEKNMKEENTLEIIKDNSEEFVYVIKGWFLPTVGQIIKLNMLNE